MAFYAVRDTFNENSNADGALDIVGVQVVLEKLGTPEIDKEELRKIFNMADLDSSHAIDFREFLICAALECFLKISFSNCLLVFL